MAMLGVFLPQTLNMQTIFLSSLQPVLQQTAESLKFTYEGPSHSVSLSIKRFDPAAACWSSDRPQQLSSYCLSTTNTLLAYWPFHTCTHAPAHTHTCILSSASNSCQGLVFLWFCRCASWEKHDLCDIHFLWLVHTWLLIKLMQKSCNLSVGSSEDFGLILPKHLRKCFTCHPGLYFVTHTILCFDSNRKM